MALPPPAVTRAPSDDVTAWVVQKVMDALTTMQHGEIGFTIQHGKVTMCKRLETEQPPGREKH